MSDQPIKGNGRTCCHMACTPNVWSKRDRGFSTLPEYFRGLQTGNKIGNYSSSLSSSVNKEQESHRSAVFAVIRFLIIFGVVMPVF